MSTLQKAFATVRAVFFPRWDPEGAWSAREVRDLPAKGKCDRRRKTVLLRHASKDDDRLHCLLIHEISHAVTDDYHSKRWLARYRKAGERAERMGRHHLASLIFEEAGLYAHPESCIRTDARSVYSLIRRFVRANPHIPFNTAIRVIALSLAHYPREFLQKWKRSRMVFHQALLEVSGGRIPRVDTERRGVRGRWARTKAPATRHGARIRQSAL